jgi:soluble lytic murein transglycosylase-like protein
MTIRTLAAPAFMALVLSACTPAALPDLASMMPAMRWDHRPEAAAWTQATLVAVAAQDDALAGAVPADIATFCPNYAKASMPERRAFWAGMLSAVAKYESSWNPKAAGGGGRYLGIMQLSPRTAAQHGCDAQSAAGLKDGAANLQCAVKVIAHAVGSDGVVVGSGRQGVARDWMPLRKSKERAEIAAWTSSQSYCH